MRKHRKWFCAAAVLLTAAAGVAAVLPGMQHSIRETGRAAVKNAVIRSAVECYAVEGAYPDSLSYLEQHYGLTVNHREYIVSYEAYAGNQLPDVQVLVRGEE